MILEGIRAVLFDLDGTLVDSMGIWKEIDVEYLGRFGLVPPPFLQKDIEGKCFSETAQYFKERFHIPDSLEKMKDDWNKMAYEKYATEINLKPGALEFLKYLKENGIFMGIATSNSLKLVEAVLRQHSIEKYIHCIVTGCEVKKGKPSPDVYLACAKKLGVKIEECLVFEDIPAGIIAGKNAGMKVVAIEDQYSFDYKDKKCELADYYIKDYYDLL